jgi:hypothetical protein
MFPASFIMGHCFLHKHKKIRGMLFVVVIVVVVVVVVAA